MANIHSIADLNPDPQNARKHNPRNLGMIRQALGEVGAAAESSDRETVVLTHCNP